MTSRTKLKLRAGLELVSNKVILVYIKIVR